MYMCMYTYIHMLHAFVCTDACMQTTFVCVCTDGYTLIKIGRGFLFNKDTMYTSVCMNVYTCMDGCNNKCIYGYTYVYVYIYVHTYLDQDWEGFSIQQRHHRSGHRVLAPHQFTSCMYVGVCVCMCMYVYIYIYV